MLCADPSIAVLYSVHQLYTAETDGQIISFSMIIHAFNCSTFLPPSGFILSSFYFRIPLYLETISGHAASVLIDEGAAVSLGIGRLGEEHALVALGLFLLANAARLFSIRQLARRLKLEGMRWKDRNIPWASRLCSWWREQPRQLLEKTSAPHSSMYRDL